MKIEGNIAWEFQNAVECHASPGVIWDFLTDISNWQQLEGETVEWIRLHGPFTAGTIGETKMPGQPANTWKLAEVKPNYSMTVEMTVDGAKFYTRTDLEVLGPDRTLIIKTMILAGPGAASMVEEIKIFESTAPQGMEKLARTIESSFAD